MNHIKSTEQVSCAERHNPANLGFLWLKIPICWFMNVFLSFDSQNFFLNVDNRLYNMCTVIDKVILPPSFPLKWGKDNGGVEKGKRTVGTLEIYHHSEAASKKIANTYLRWGSILVIVVDV